MTTWFVVILLVGCMAGGVLWAKPELREKLGLDFTAEQVGDDVADADKNKKVKRSKKRGKKRAKRRKRRAPRNGSPTERTSEDPNDFYDDEEFWDDEDLEVEDRFVIGNVFDEPDEHEYEDAPVEAPEFVPPPEMWQPDGRYTPSSRWAARGAAASDVVEISMSGNDASAPLRPDQIRAILTVNRLMPCYRDVAKKVPEMRGRVDLRLQVEANGKPSRVEVTRSQLRSKMVEDCIVNTVKRVRFPATDGRRTRFETHFDFD